MKEFPIDPLTAEEDEIEGIAYQAYQALLNQLSEDQIVRTDRYTGCRIVEKEVATSYINWLMKSATRSATQVPPHGQINVDFNRMAFFGSSIGSGMGQELKIRQRIYQGGSRTPSVTARAVLTLVKGGAPSTWLMRMDYLVNSRILYISGGNHRSIAYKLLGLTNFPAEKITVYDDFPDEPLNRALLCLESLYTLPDPRDTKIVVGSQQTLALELGEKYGANSLGSRPNELYRFTKLDLTNPVASQSAVGNTSFLDLLAHYAAVCATLSQPKGKQSWWQQRFQRQNIAALPDPIQESIRRRWLEWRAGR